MPYRSRPGGVFGSGLYQGGEPNGNAGEIIDAVSRGATSLIQVAMLRAQQKRQNAIQDIELARQAHGDQREDEKFGLEKQRFASEQTSRARAEDRADQDQDRQNFESGYTPKKKVKQDVVEAGAVESNGLFGKPGRVTAPKIAQRELTIPAAYSFAASKTAAAKKLEVQVDEKKRGEHMADAKTMADYRENLRRGRPSSGGASTSETRAAVRVEKQIAEMNSAINRLQTRKDALAPELPADKKAIDAIDAQMKPMIQRRDSLSGVRDDLAAQLTAAASGSTIAGAYGKKGKKKAPPSEQLQMWDKAAASLKRKGQDPYKKLGARPAA